VVLLYGCETWSLTLREQHRLRVFENRVLRRIFGSRRDDVTGEWRELHNEELRDFYSSKTKKLHGLSPRANYTDRATAACRRRFLLFTKYN
jgi:hypothetical protein